MERWRDDCDIVDRVSGAVKSDAGRQTHLELHRDANVSAWELWELGCSEYIVAS